MELLAIKIRSSEKIREIQISNNEIKISQLEDDTSLFIRDTDSIKHIFDLLKLFGNYAGLKANVEKTQFHNIGAKLVDDENRNGFNFEKGPIHLLGLTVTADEKLKLKKTITDRKNFS